jgi:predicted GH43/DUF377 family glycosyl hydrolase
MNKYSTYIVTLMILAALFFPVLTISLERADGAAASPVKWIKYASNPVFSAGSSNAWDDAYIYSCCVLNFSGTLRLYYTGGPDYPATKLEVGLATSTDGKSWTRYSGNPILSPGSSGAWDDAGVGFVSVIPDNGSYSMWYAGKNGSILKIGYANSTDGINWTKNSGNPVMGLGAAGSWESTSVSHPKVLLENGTYRMWYQGHDGSYGRIGYAESADGTNWTKYGSNPVLGLGSSGAWDYYGLHLGTVVNVSGNLRMWYCGYGGTYTGIGHASSSDGKSWTKYSYNPVLNRVSSTWERRSVEGASVLYDGSSYRIWYTGASDQYSPWVFKFGYAEGWNTVPYAPSLSSPSNNVWTTDNTPTFSWSFSDPNSQDGQTAYRLQMDEDSLFGSINYESGKISSTTWSYTPADNCADGIYYWRVMTWDSDDDPSSWSSYRIIKIDVTPPQNPTGLTSSSHTIDVWSSTDSTIDVQFSGASDATSGLDGYSYVWDYTSATIPDNNKDIEETTSSRTSPSMSDSATIYFHIKAFDNAGNRAIDAVHIGPFKVDRTPPLNPSITSSTHAVSVWSQNNTALVDWSGADASVSGVDGYSVVWDGSASTLPDTVKEYGATAASSISPVLSDGAWYFHIRTADQAGNWAQTASHYGPISVDATPPANPLSLESTSHRPEVWSNDPTVDVGWESPNAAVSGVDGFSLAWDESNLTLPDDLKDCEETSLSHTSGSLADGASHYFHLRVRDNAGNWNCSAMHLGPFWIDTTPPLNPVSLESQSHKLYTWSNDSTVEVRWSLPPRGAELSGYDGFAVLWDVWPSTVPPAFAELGPDVNLTESPPLKDGGAYYFHIRAVDRAGNWADDAAHLGPFRIDTSAPSNPTRLLSASHLVGAWSNDSTLDIAWSGVDASISGLEGYYAEWSHAARWAGIGSIRFDPDATGCTSAQLPDGADWYFHLRVRDIAGNLAAGCLSLGPFHIDTSAPKVTGLAIGGGAAYANRREANVSLSFEDAPFGSGVAHMRSSFDGATWTEWEPASKSFVAVLPGSDGEKVFFVQVMDGVRLPSPAVSSTIFLDMAPPAVTQVELEGGAGFTRTATVVVRLSARDIAPASGIDRMSICTDGKNWGPWEAWSEQAGRTLPGGDGRKSVSVRVMDRAGNTGATVSDDIFLDTEPPSAVTLTIEEGAIFTNRSSVALRLAVADAEPSSGIAEMRFSEDGFNWNVWQPFAWSARHQFSPGDGLRTLHFMVRDRAANPSGTASGTIKLDTTPPLFCGALVSGVSGVSAVVAWRTDEPSQGELEFLGAAAPIGFFRDPELSTEHFLAVTGLSPGVDYQVRVRAVDRFGNGPSFSPNLSFSTLKKTDRLPPVVTNLAVDSITDRMALVSWDTDEPSDSLVEYGTGGAPPSQSSSSRPVLHHQVLLQGLAANTRYTVWAKSIDTAGNGPGRGGPVQFSTRSGRDSSAPVISGLAVKGATASLAIACWETDEPATGAADFGSGGDLSRTVTESGFGRVHSVVLNGLLPLSTYGLRVHGRDISGNGPSYSEEISFTTPASGDSSPPVPRAVNILSIGPTTVTVEVVFDEPASLVVDFGTARSYGGKMESGRFLTTHTITLSGLTPKTTYHYRVLSSDPSGNGPYVGPDAVFQTKPGKGEVETGNDGMAIAAAVIIAAAALTALLLWRRRSRASPRSRPSGIPEDQPSGRPGAASKGGRASRGPPGGALSVALILAMVLLATQPLMWAPDASGESGRSTSWTRYAQNPVFTASGSSWDRSYLSSSCVIRDGSEFKMYYTASDNSGYYRIGLATSSDGLSWTRYGSSPVINVGPTGSWDRYYAFYPCVIKDGSMYKMWYSGYGGSYYAIGYATSSDGKSWTKYSGNPVLTVGQYDQWDGYYAYMPCVIQDGSEYKMWYTGYSQYTYTGAIGLATSTDGISWSKSPSNPCLATGGPGSYDYSIFGCSVVKAANVYKMYYSGYDTNYYYNIAYATSPDGSSWTKYNGNPLLARQGNGWEGNGVWSPSVLYDSAKLVYRMWYTGYSSSGYSGTSIGYAEGNGAPRAPELGTPSNETWVRYKTQTFRWTFNDPNAGDTQTAFELQLDDDPAFRSPNYDSKKTVSPLISAIFTLPVSDGLYYWRVMTWDGDDEGSPWSIPNLLGIDTTPPANPIVLRSTSHTAGAWSGDTTVDMEWILPMSGGALSGYDGFSVCWDRNPNGVPDNTAEFDANTTTATSPPLSDGVDHYFHVRARDRAGNWASGTQTAGPYLIDTVSPVHPTVICTSHGVDVWSSDRTVDVQWTAAECGISGIAGYSVVWSNRSNTIPPEVVNASESEVSLTSPPLSDGSWYFHLRAKSNSGRWTQDGVHLGPLLIDTQAPSITGLTFDEGATIVTDPIVSMAITAEDRLPGSGISQMRYRLDGRGWSEWKPFQKLGTLELPREDGLRTISVQLQDGANNTSPVVTGTVLLDTAPPSYTALKLDGGAAYTNRLTIPCSIDADDGPAGSGVQGMSVSFDGHSWGVWEPFFRDMTVTLPQGEGPRAVMARLRDAAGNIGQTVTGTIFVDTVAPSSVTVVLAGGAQRTNRQTVALSLGAIDIEPSSGTGTVSFSEDGANWSAWMPFQPSLNYTLRSADGPCTLYCRVRDRALNPAEQVKISFNLDTAPPEILWFRITGAGERNATVEVAVNENSEVRLLYGRTSSYGGTVSSGRQAKVHTIQVTGLQPGKAYRCRVTATDASGNGPVRTAEFLLKTKAPPQQSSSPFSGDAGLTAAAFAAGIMAALLVAVLYTRARASRAVAGRTDTAMPPEAGVPAAEPPPVPTVRVARRVRSAPHPVPEAPGGRMTIQEVVNIEDLDDDGALEELPMDPPTKEVPRERAPLTEEGLAQLISSLPRGLPSSLWGMENRELARQVLQGERRTGDEGERLVRLGKRWYFADPEDVGTFLQPYQGR